jgi:hypothetical protein
MAGKKEAAEQRYASESDLFKSMMEGQNQTYLLQKQSQEQLVKFLIQKTQLE